MFLKEQEMFVIHEAPPPWFFPILYTNLYGKIYELKINEIRKVSKKKKNVLWSLNPPPLITAYSIYNTGLKNV